MKLRSMSIIGAILVAGCTVPKPQIAIPNTTEARRCGIKCDESYSTCRAGCPVKLFTGYPCTSNCADAYKSCMQLCPGTSETP